MRLKGDCLLVEEVGKVESLYEQTESCYVINRRTSQGLPNLVLFPEMHELQLPWKCKGHEARPASPSRFIS
jgi:hypothetical protein